MTTLRLHAATPFAPANPRGARAGAAVFLALYRLLGGLVRAARPRPQRTEHDLQAVRELAWRHMEADPRFAADLLASADHHERMLSRL